MSPRQRNRLDKIITKADVLLCDYDRLEEQLAETSRSALTQSIKSALSVSSGEIEIATDAARTERLKAVSSLSEAASAILFDFCDESGPDGVVDVVGLDTLPSVDDQIACGDPRATASLACVFAASGKGKERDMTVRKASGRCFDALYASETDADGFKKPLPPKRIHKSSEDILSFLDSPPPGDEASTESESANASSSHDSSSLGDRDLPPTSRDARREEEEEAEVAQERERRLMDDDYDSFGVLDLSLPKRP